MTRTPPARWSFQRYRLGMVTALLLVGAGFVFLRQPSTEAGGPPFSPQTAAFFPSDKLLEGKLVLAVALSNPQEAELAGKLDVELLGADGKVLASTGQAVRQQDPALGYRFELTADKTKAADLTVRCRLAGRTFETPLSKILLHKAHETSFTSSLEFFAGSNAPFRCEVHGVRTARETLPLPNSQVTVRLKEKDGKYRTLYTGRSGKDGRADAAFEVPALPTGQYTLEVKTRSALGEETLERAVRIIADAKLLLVTDKPIYQPGQLMHLRALALRPFDLRPVENQDLLFEVEDSKGNKVFKKTLKTSAYGVASVDFQLADEVNMGNYNLRAILGDQRAEKTVSVKRYVLPKFKANVTSDKSFYLPKETIKAELQSDYFFGKPVANAKLEVTAETFDVAFRKFQTWNGKTDANGHAKFEIQLPDYFVGQPLAKGNALVKLDVKVTDTADHSETISRSYTVSEHPIVLSLIPEGGKLVPAMENRIFAATVYPDGSPAPNTEVKLWLGKEAKGEPVATMKTNEAGLAELKITPKAEQFRQGNAEQRNIEMLGGVQVGWMPAVLLDVRAEARDAKGNTAKVAAELNSHPLGENVLLRLDKAIYRAGDSLNAEVRSSAGVPTVYLDITRGGQIVLSRWMAVKEGQATHRLDLPQTLFGSLEVHAYQMLHTGEIIRDSRVVYVHPRDDLKIEVKADKNEYLPGANGRIRFHVTDSQGKPTAAALGIIVVDEAVYALQDLQPGLEKVYFTLQEELMKPQVQVKLRPSDTIDNLVRVPALPAPRQQVAEVLLTSVKVRPPARWDVEPALQRKLQFDGQVAQIGWGLYQYAWHNDSAIQFDEKANRWTFRKDILQEATRAGHVNGAALNAPFGGTLSLEELARTEKEFDVDHLARALTRHRMERLAEAFVKYSDALKEKWFKDGRWTFPAAILSDAAANQGLDAHWLRDGWGQGFKLVKRTAKADHKTGHSQFDLHDIVSAGPDRDYSTADDVAWTQGGKKLAGGWWNNGQAAHRVALAQMDPRLGGGRGFGRGGLEREQFLKRFDRDGRAANGPVGGAMPPMAAPGGAGDMARKLGEGKAKGEPGQQAAGQAGGAAPIKVREYFPETMLWQPALITDDNGVANLAVNFADSITTWRLSASANSRSGSLGGVTVPLKVFQDFFVDIDLPVTLTQNDEVAFPVAVYNYLKTPQSVKIELQAEPWFSLLDEGGLSRTLNLKPEEVTAVRFRIKANKIGWQPLTVNARGSKQSDAVKRTVEVVPDGEKVEKVVNDRLSGKITQVIDVPQNAIPDASKLLVRIYPGVVAQVLDGVEGMIRLPGG